MLRRESSEKDSRRKQSLASILITSFPLLSFLLSLSLLIFVAFARFPTNPRTFVILLVTVALPYEGQSDIPSSTSSKEPTAVKPNRSFMVISVPFSHPSCPPRQGPESKRVRGRYCSVEVVRELPPSGHGHGHGDDDDEENRIQWRMATTSDAGGNIPQWMTNMSLPGKISEDVPSFLKWIGEQ